MTPARCRHCGCPLSSALRRAVTSERRCRCLVRLVSEIAPRSVDIAPAIDLIHLIHVELSNGQVVDGALQHEQRERLLDFFNTVPVSSRWMTAIVSSASTSVTSLQSTFEGPKCRGSIRSSTY